MQALSAQVGGLQTELHALRSQVRPLPEPADAPGWGDSPSARRESSPWVRTLERPAPRGPAVPRLLIEVAFLAAVALAAALAELDPLVIALVMAGAWVLVALAEWMAARAARRHGLRPGGAAVRRPAPSSEKIRPGSRPPVEHTAIEPAAEDDDTQTRLPAPATD